MITPTQPIPFSVPVAGFRRFTVDEYHRLIEIGILTENDNLELLEGYLVHKMSRNPPHDGTYQKVLKRLLRCIPPEWDARGQCAITLAESEPEPDIAVVRDDPRGYMTRHPEPADCGLIIEVSDSTLSFDRADKSRIYAGAGIAVYWVVNVVDGQIEVYHSPNGTTYADRQDYRPGDTIPLVLDGVTVAQLSVAELIG